DGSTTTIAVNFTNPAPTTFPYNPGTVDARTGTLQFTGPVSEKRGGLLFGGIWSVTSSTGTLLLPGEDIQDASETFSLILRGDGAAFPQLEGVRTLYALHLENGRQFTFSHLGQLIDGPNTIRVYIDSPGDTIVVPRVQMHLLSVGAGTATAPNG